MNQKVLLSVLGAALISIGAFGAVKAYAEDITSPTPSIVTRIAERFNLNVDEVKSVFEEEHDARREDMKAKLEDRLNQLVEDGELTTEKKQLILDKMSEMEANRVQMMEEMKDLTPEERRTTMNAHHEELKSWADENGIDLKYLRFTHKFHDGHGMKGDFMMRGAE